jgi:hypothetical protein
MPLWAPPTRTGVQGIPARPRPVDAKRTSPMQQIGDDNPATIMMMGERDPYGTVDGA